MQPASPARLYATATGALLVVLGIACFAYSASFGSPGAVEAALGALRVNGWLSCLYVATGTAGLLCAAVAPRAFAIAAGCLFTVLAVWGWTLGAGDAILGFLPAEGADEGLALLLGLLGLAAAWGTPRGSGRPKRARKGPRERSEARAEAAG